MTQPKVVPCKTQGNGGMNYQRVALRLVTSLMPTNVGWSSNRNENRLPGRCSGTRLEEFVGEKVDKWVNEVTKLADFAISQPQASYAAFTFGLRHRWTYFLRTLPDIAELLEPLERAINEVLIPAVTDHTVTKVERDLLGLPVRMGGLGFTDPVVTSSSEYEASIEVTNPLVRRIVEQEHQPPLRCLRNSNTATEHTKTSKWRIPCRQKLSELLS